MREYLKSFFYEFEYEKEDAQFLLGAYDSIVSDDEARSILDETLGIYDKNIKCGSEVIIKNSGKIARLTKIHEFTIELLVFICMSRKLREVYKERQISEEIFHNSVLDLKYKLEECKIVRGIKGSFVAFWFMEFFDMTRFALGRLQFEIVEFKRNYEKNGIKLTPESKVLNMHIPRTGTPLTPESCMDSYKQAEEFFKEELDGPCVFVCDSWLLYPEHKKILPETSNIRKFAEQFDIIDNGIFRDNRELWRFFDTNEQNPDRLPADSSLRRIYVDYLKKGGRVGWGYGVITNYKALRHR